MNLYTSNQNIKAVDCITTDNCTNLLIALGLEKAVDHQWTFGPPKQKSEDDFLSLDEDKECSAWTTPH